MRSRISKRYNVFAKIDRKKRAVVRFRGPKGTSKPTNPKDLLGVNKIPFHLWPMAATVLGSLALLDGALKYGRSNWRAMGVRWSIYHDAALRHLVRAFEGQDNDPDSQLDHLGHALASIAIIIDARMQGNLIDDRMYFKHTPAFEEFLAAQTRHVDRLRAKYADRHPKHFTRADVVGERAGRSKRGRVVAGRRRAQAA